MSGSDQVRIFRAVGNREEALRSFAAVCAIDGDSTPILVDLTEAESIDDAFLVWLGELRLSNPNMSLLVSNTAVGVRFLATLLFEQFRVYTNREEAFYAIAAGQTVAEQT